PVAVPPAPVFSSVSTAEKRPAPIVNFENIEPPPAVRPMTPMFPMETPFAQAPPPAAPPPPATSTTPGNGYSRSSSSSTIELSESLRETVLPAADLAVTAFNTATERTTANNATVAVPGLANEVKEARRRRASGGIVTTLLLLAAISGGGAYLWRTGLLEVHAPTLAARLPPSPASAAKPPAETVAAAPTTTPPARPAEAAKPPAAPASPAPPATPTTTASASETKSPATPAATPEIKLSITTTPAGVKVQADGAQIGVAPLELAWPAGKPVKLRFSKPGFKTTTRAFTPKADGTLEVGLQPAESEELKDVY
ncbi:MAG TPA: PEGA domain-containing protein, partial [Myxococcales bacterium]|nr:PEGA domain-containing protein [Myxococcales bacterium]